MSINSVSISGNLGRDSEIRSTQSGTSILTFPLAVGERIKKGDNWEEYTNWIDVVVFGRRADSLSKILAKGMKVAVNGRLRYSSWERDGQKRSKIEVIAEEVDLMQRRSDGDGSRGYGNGGSANYSDDGGNAAQNGSHGFSDGSDEFAQDDYPF